jgi:hypothetical protein
MAASGCLLFIVTPSSHFSPARAGLFYAEMSERVCQMAIRHIRRGCSFQRPPSSANSAVGAPHGCQAKHSIQPMNNCFRFIRPFSRFGSPLGDSLEEISSVAGCTAAARGRLECVCRPCPQRPGRPTAAKVMRYRAGGVTRRAGREYAHSTLADRCCDIRGLGRFHWLYLPPRDAG